MDLNNIKRSDLRANRDKIFLFGDNLEHKGFGGQAKEMRGEPNAYGIPVKKKPSMEEDAFFADDEFSENVKAIRQALDCVPNDGRDIVISAQGIGTGRARLKEKAPETFSFLQNALKYFQV